MNRFRDSDPSEVLNDSKLGLYSPGNDSLDLTQNDIRTELEITDRYTALPDAYLEVSNDEIEIPSPLPVSKISIQPRAGQGRTAIGVRSSDHAKFRNESHRTSSDILQEWRANRKNDILKYKYHLEHVDGRINERKQDYYQHLTDKYLSSKQSEPVANHPVTQFTSDFSKTNHATPPMVPLTPPIYRSIGTQQNVPYTSDNIECVNVAVQNCMAEDKGHVPTLGYNRIGTTRDNDRIADKPVKQTTTHSVQTMNTREVQIQTTPPVSPPIRGPIEEHGPTLEETAWSISSVTTPEHISNEDVNISPAPEVISVTDVRESVEMMEQDELLKLLLAKASFYEQHIHNIDTLLDNYKIK